MLKGTGDSGYSIAFLQFTTFLLLAHKLTSQLKISLLTSEIRGLSFFYTVIDFVVFLNKGNLVFGNPSWNFFAPFSTSLSTANANAILLSISSVCRILSVKRWLTRVMERKQRFISINQYLCQNLGHRKYNLFEVTKFILVLPKFRLIQQLLSGTRCWI